MANQPVKKQNDANIFLNNYFNIILALILIVFLLLAYLVFLGPKFRATQAAIQANTEEKQLLYEATQKRLANLQAIRDIYQKISPTDMQKFNSVLPDSYVRERLFGELEEIIARGGWLISNIIISPEDENSKPATLVPGQIGVGPHAPAVANNKKIGTVSIQLSLLAIDYPGFKNLLRILENNLRLFDVTSISFSPSDSSATVVITTYYYKSL